MNIVETAPDFIGKVIDPQEVHLCRVAKGGVTCDYLLNLTLADKFKCRLSPDSNTLCPRAVIKKAGGVIGG